MTTRTAAKRTPALMARSARKRADRALCDVFLFKRSGINNSVKGGCDLRSGRVPNVLLGSRLPLKRRNDEILRELFQCSQVIELVVEQAGVLERKFVVRLLVSSRTDQASVQLLRDAVFFGEGFQPRDERELIAFRNDGACVCFGFL